MSKKVFNWMLMAAVVLGFSMTFTACSDDDDKLSAEERAEKEAAEQAEKASKFWNVAGQLVGTLQATDDYASKTYEPTIGEPQPGNTTVRLVVTDDVASAAQRFADLVGLEDGTINSETDTYSWSDPDVGTLTYTKSTDGQSLATVDVSIKQIPKLQKIIYLTLAQKGDNANYTTCYYRFGDVISRANEDGITEYWVCVRPSFEPEGKGDSHWITLSPLPKKNIYSYTSKTNKITYTLPKNLGVNKKHMQNLAEMVWAMAKPKRWEDDIKDNPYTSIFNKGVPMFNDFDKNLVKYHSQEFWKNVNDGWEQTKVTLSKNTQVDLWHAIFADSRDGMASSMADGGGLHLLCDGYSWNTTFSNSPTLYEYTYKNGLKAESNCHNVTYTKPSRQVIYKNDPGKDIEISVATDYTDLQPYLKLPEFFGNHDRHYIIRHATGDELSALTGTVYNKKRPIDGFTEVYNYNKRYGITDLDVEPEVRNDILYGGRELEEPVVGCILGQDGKFYTTIGIADLKSKAAAFVVYLGDSDNPVETDTEYTGLAIALKRVFTVQYSEYSSETDCGLKGAFGIDELRPRLDGISNTKQLAAGCGKEHNHPAAKTCVDFTPKVGEEGLQTYDFSGWFIPASGQWILAYKGLGLTWDDEWGFVYDDQHTAERLAATRLLEKAGVTFNNYTLIAWSSTPFLDSRINTMGLEYNRINPAQGAGMKMSLIPFIAFKKK